MRRTRSHDHRAHPLVQSNLSTRPRFQNWFLLAVIGGILFALSVLASQTGFPALICERTETKKFQAGQSSTVSSRLLHVRLKCVYPRIAVVAAKRTNRSDSTSDLLRYTFTSRPMNVSATADGTLVSAHFVEHFHRSQGPEQSRFRGRDEVT